MQPRLLLLAVFFGIGALACGPLGPIPGGRLSGELGPPELSDWSPVAAVETAHFETRPSDPHSVSTWFVALGPRLYVPTSMILGPKDPRERSWVANVAADPRVRIRIDGRVYERSAVRIDGAEYDRAREALETKYALDPAERDADRSVWIYRLDPR